MKRIYLSPLHLDGRERKNILAISSQTIHEIVLKFKKVTTH